MSLIELVAFLVIAAVCGAIGQAITGFSRGGCLVSIGVGFVGALIGTWIARSLALPPVLVLTFGGVDFPVVWSILGSALFVAVIALISGRRV
jgi:uncharacterized membrane protein YeaQ/YmgE (transglycosylase-associated protein family)